VNQNVQTLVIDRFANLYGAPETEDPSQFMAEYSRALSGFPAAVIKSAIDRIIDENEYRFWPTVGTCKKACQRLMPEPVLQFPKTDRDLPPPTPEAKARCRALAAELRATVGRNNVVGDRPRQKFMPPDREAWTARRAVGVTRHGDPLRKPA
jgi:hypothetical protein